MPAGNSFTESTTDKNNIPRLYNWLVYLELERALNKFGAKKGFLSRVTSNAIDGEPITNVESKIHAFNSKPFYKRIFASLFTNINELISLNQFYKAKKIQDKLTINADFNLVEWNKALDELKSLDKEANKNLPFFNLQYYYDWMTSWWPIKAKNKQYIFNSVNHAFANPENWKDDNQKVMNLRELKKVKSVNKIAKYLHRQADDYISDDNILNITSEQLDRHKWRLTEFNNAVKSYYKDESWTDRSKTKRKNTIEAISTYINDAVVKITALFPLATYYKCLAVFRNENSRENSEAKENAEIALRDQKSIKCDSYSAVKVFKWHEFESNSDLSIETINNIEETKAIEAAEEQYRRLHICTN